MHTYVKEGKSCMKNISAPFRFRKFMTLINNIPHFLFFVYICAYVHKGRQVIHEKSLCSILISESHDVDKYLPDGWLRQKIIWEFLAKLKLASQL